MGKKSLICDRLISSLETASPILPKSLLSIDMGVRNFAFCLFVPSKDGISIKEWRRMEVVGKGAPSSSFEPIPLSGVAYQICKALVSLKPEHILVERQRHRSGRSNAVLEWTLRVNTLEAMIHAILHTFTQESDWSGRIECISPKRVTDYWIHDRSENLTSSKLKVEKIRIVADMIKRNNPSNVHFESCVQDIVLAFIGKKKGQKLDDVADSFLQGMTWILWQQAKLQLKNHLKLGKDLSVEELLALLND